MTAGSNYLILTAMLLIKNQLWLMIYYTFCLSFLCFDSFIKAA